MRGDVWEFWIFGMVAFFIAIIIYFTITPFFETLITTVTTGGVGNFTTTAINTSYHRTVTYTFTLWNLWPLAVGGLVLLLFFIAASEEEKLQTRRF